MLILAGSVPAEAFFRAVVRAYEERKAEQVRAAVAAPMTPATVMLSTTAASNAPLRANVPAPLGGSSTQWENTPINPAMTTDRSVRSYPAPSRPLPASSQSVAPAALHAPGTNSISGGPRPAAAYNYTTGLIVDSTDNPTGITGIGSADTLTVSGDNFVVGNFNTGVFTQSGGTVTTAPDAPLILAFHPSSNGTYNLQGGTLDAGASVIVGYNGTGIFNQSGGTLKLGNSNTLIIGFNDNSNSTYKLSAGTLTTPETIVSDQGNTSVFTQSGSSVHTVGSLLLSNFQSDSNGTYNLDGGVLNAGFVSRGTSTVALGTGTFNFNGGTLQAAHSDAPNAAMVPFVFFGNLTAAQVRDGGAFIDTNTFNVTVSQGLVHSGIAGDKAIDGGLTKNGAGTLTLTGVSTYTGDTSVNAGTVAVTAGGLNATRNVIVNNGTLTLGGAGNITATSLSIANGTFNQTGGTVRITTSGGVTVGSNGAGTVNQTGGTLNASGTPLIIGYFGSPGTTYNLSGATSQLSTGVAFLGYTSPGTFVQNDGSFTTNGSSFEIGFFPGGSGTYMLNGGSLSTGGFLVGDQGTGTFSQSGGTFTTNGNALNVGSGAAVFASFTLGGGTLTTGSTAITGGSSSSTFTQSGGTHITGSLTIGSANANSAGVYNLDGGTLSVGSISGAAGTSRLFFNGGIVQPRGDSTNFISGITGANVRNGGAIFDTNGFNVTVPQVLAHTTFEGDNGIDGGLIKNSTGILSLTGANTYTGATTVNGGTLAANNTSGSATGPGAVTVQANATLAGNGTVAGNVTLNAAAFLNPGNGGPGRLTLGGKLTSNAGSAFALDLGGTTAGSGYDQIVLAGPVTVGGLYSIAGNLSVTSASGFTLTVNQKFFIIDETGTNAVGGIGAFTNAPGSIYTDAAGDRFLVNYADINPADGDLFANDVSLTVLSVAAVPEPATWAMLGLGLVLGLIVRRQLRVAI